MQGNLSLEATSGASGIRSRHSARIALESAQRVGSNTLFLGLFRLPRGALSFPTTPLPSLRPPPLPPPPSPSTRNPPFPLSSPLQARFPDALDYFSIIIALLCTAPPFIALCHYMGDVRTFTFLRTTALIALLGYQGTLSLQRHRIAYRANVKKYREYGPHGGGSASATTYVPL